MGGRWWGGATVLPLRGSLTRLTGEARVGEWPTRSVGSVCSWRRRGEGLAVGWCGRGVGEREPELLKFEDVSEEHG